MSNRLKEMMEAKQKPKAAPADSAKDSNLSEPGNDSVQEMTSGEVTRMKFEESMVDKTAIVLLLDQLVFEDQVRADGVDEDKVKRRAESIRKYKQFHPIVVEDLGNGKYRVLDGEYRSRAMMLLQQENPIKYSTIKAQLRDEVEDELERYYMQAHANMQRDDLSDSDIVSLYEKDIALNPDLTQKEFSQKLGFSKSKISKALMLMDMDVDLSDAVSAGDMSPSAAREKHSQRKADKKKTPSQKAATSAKKTDQPKVARLSVSQSEIENTCLIFQKLAEQLDLPVIELSKVPTRKELIQIMEQRTQEIKKAFL